MNNKDAVIAFYTPINRLYSINYSATRIFSQRESKKNAEQYKFNNHSTKEDWIDAKLDHIADIRHFFFKSYYPSINENLKFLKILKIELEKSKKELQEHHNSFFKKDMPFEEIFDNFVCKSPKMAEFLKIIDMQSFVTNNKNLADLAHAYVYYMTNLFYYTVVSSMLDNVEQLEKDISENGVPTLYNGIPQNERVSTISIKELKQVRTQIEQAHNILKKEKKHKNNNTRNLSLQTALSKYLEANAFLTQLEERLKFANTDAESSLTNKIVEGALDFFTKSKIKNATVISNIYVTKLELSYMEYITNSLNIAMEQFSDYINSNDKQIKTQQ